MKSIPDLHIYEEIMLLALSDKKGTIHFGIHYQVALASAIIAELLLKEKIITEDKKKFIKVIDAKPVGDNILDECLSKIRNSSRRAGLSQWIIRFSNINKLKHRAALNLCRKGVLKMQEDHILLIFKRKLYPELNHKPENAIIERLREAIFTDTNEIDANTIILISLCNSTGMLNPLFDKKELRSRKNRIKEITEGNDVGYAAKSAVEAIQAAVMVAAIIPAMTASATIH